MRKARKNQNVSNFTYFLYIVFIISFFLHLPSRIPGIGVVRPDLLLVILISCMLFIESYKLKGRLDNKCSRIMLVFIGYLIISIPFVEWPGSVLRENLALFIKAAVFFFFTVLIIDTDKKLRLLILVVVLCQIFRVFEPLLDYLTTGQLRGYTHIGGGNFAGRLSGSKYDVINANGLGFVIATVFPFIHYLWGTSNWKKKLLYFSVAPGLLYALVLTLSRSGFIAMLVITWNIFIRSKYKLFIIITIVAVAVFSWSQMSFIQKDRYLSLTGDDTTVSSGSFQGRIDAMWDDFEVGFNRPIVGHGIGTSGEAIWNVRRGRNISHTLYAEIIIETGIIGFVIFMLFLKATYDSLKRVIIIYYSPDKHHNGPQNIDEIPDYEYKLKLTNALRAVFWMYIIFSIAQYGLNEYHWFLFAGITTVLTRQIYNNKTNE